jgi:hypothetical protein
VRAFPLALACFLVTASAGAQTPDPAMLAAAEALFQEGKRALDEGNYALACPRLADSLQLDPAGGTALLLAICLEAQGKLASAWAAYNGALSLARRDHREDREKQARERIALLEPTMPRLRFRGGDVAGAEVRLDSRLLPLSARELPLPVDPGPHELTATAPGYLTWSQAFTLGPGETRELEITPLVAPPPGLPAAPRPPRASWHQPVGHGALGAAGAALGFGATFGVLAWRKATAADRVCPGTECLDSRAIDLTGQAKTASAIANVGIGLGLALGSFGAIVLLGAPSGAAVTLSPAPGGLEARAHF